MSFYVCDYLILSDSIDPQHDSDSWAFPTTVQQHLSDTSNAEDLLIDPEDMDAIPTQIQFGACSWTSSESMGMGEYDTFYVTEQLFYIRNFTPLDYWSEFYAGTDSFTEFYTSIVGFYVRSFSGVDLWSEFYTSADVFTDSFYTQEPSWYVRSFSRVDFFYPIDWVVC